MQAFDEAVVSLLVHQVVHLLGIAYAQLHEPAIAHRVAVDAPGLAGELAVDGDDFARERREDLARRLDRFDHRRLLALLHAPADLRQLDIDDVAELALRVVGDADDDGVALDADPLVILGVFDGGHGEPRRKSGWVSTAIVAMGNERQRRDARRPRRAAHHELHRRAERRLPRRDIAHGDRPVGRGAKAAAGDAADHGARGIDDLRALARRRAPLGLDADALPRRAFLELTLDHGGAGKAAFDAAALL